VASGHNPGVYTDWTTAQEQIKGWKLPKYKRFSTRGEAEAFVQAGGRPSKVDSGTTELIDEDEQPEDFDDEISEVESPAVPSKRRKTSPAASVDQTKTSQSTVQIAATTSAAKSRAADAKSKPLSIYTDGSSLANGKVGAVAGVGVFFGDGDDRYVSACNSIDDDSVLAWTSYTARDTDFDPLGTFPRH
jgi:ribonuclease HI